MKAAGLIKNCGIPIAVKENNYDVLRTEYDCVGFADYYLNNSWDKTDLVNKADEITYQQLLDIDTKLGTTQTEQLFKCVRHSSRMDLIKVYSFGFF